MRHSSMAMDDKAATAGSSSQLFLSETKWSSQSSDLELESSHEKRVKTDHADVNVVSRGVQLTGNVEGQTQTESTAGNFPVNAVASNGTVVGQAGRKLRTLFMKVIKLLTRLNRNLRPWRPLRGASGSRDRSIKCAVEPRAARILVGRAIVSLSAASKRYCAKLRRPGGS